MGREGGALETSVLLLTPAVRDAALATRALGEAGIPAVFCASGDALINGIACGAGTAVLSDEALTPELVAALERVLAQQLPWSDFPFLVLTERGAAEHEDRRARETIDVLGNVTHLERPLHGLAMISGVRAALRTRAHQYAVRAVFEEHEREVRQRDQFLAMLGHELRNPLGALRNAAEIVQHRTSGLASIERAVSVIHRQVHHLTRLVDDLLDVARVTSGKIALQKAPTDLRGLCAGLVDESRRASRDRGLALSFEAHAAPIIVLGDRVRLEQVVNNLLTNALKYTPAGGQVDVSLDMDPAADEAVLRVADSGVGISAEMLRTIFEPFTQSERTLDRAQGGMGLGLSVVRTLVHLHGGDVTATSSGLGHGTTLTVRLPLARTARLDLDDRPPASRREAPARRILVVEDSQDNRETLRDLLQNLGHEVHVASDGVEGIAQALALRPEVALVDIGLPFVDGFEVARRVRAVVGPETFLVALSGYGQPEDRTRAVAAGFDAHLTKPLDVSALAQMLVSLVPSAERSVGLTAASV